MKLSTQSFRLSSAFIVIVGMHTGSAYAGLLDMIKKDAEKVEHVVSDDVHKVEHFVEKGASTIKTDVKKVIHFTESEAKKTAPKVFGGLSTVAHKIASKSPDIVNNLFTNRDKIERVIQLGLTEGKPAEDILNLIINEVPLIGPLVDFGGNEALDAINAIITADLALQGK